MTLLEQVPGQASAVAQLLAARTNPLHAYLFEGPPGAGKRMAALAFAASLLCERGGCGECRSCRLVQNQRHPDVRVVEPEGAFLMVKQADEIVVRAALTPAEGRWNVMVLVDFHQVHPQAAPKLLKTLEEPPQHTVFLILTEQVPPELLTIASRCVRIPFGPLAPEVIGRTLVAEGVEPSLAQELAPLSHGRLDRARLLATDPGFAARRQLWQSLPRRLDGTGAAVALAVADITAALDAAGSALEVRQAEELHRREESARATGERLTGRKELADHHKRALRRLRTDELRSGLATLASVYREAIATSEPATMATAHDLLLQAAAALVRNPNEGLLLESLLLRLPPLAAVPGTGTELR